VACYFTDHELEEQRLIRQMSNILNASLKKLKLIVSILHDAFYDVGLSIGEISESVYYFFKFQNHDRRR